MPCPHYRTFKKLIEENESDVTISHIAAEKLARFSRPFTDDEFLTECMQSWTSAGGTGIPP